MSKSDTNNTFFRDLVKSINSDNMSVLDDGKTAAEFTGTVDTGSYILNALFSGSIWGGVPNNKITAFAGESSAGKTYFLLSLVASFLEKNPKGAVFYFDTEAAVTKEMMVSRGIDPSRVIVVEPVTIQEFRHSSLQILDRYAKTPAADRPPMAMVLDSLGQLSTSKEIEDSEKGSDTKDMTRAATIKAAFRVLTLKCAKLNVPIWVSNHVYSMVGAYIPTKEMSGGTGLRYVASQIGFLSKRKEKDDTTKEVVGNIIKVRLDKSRLTREQKAVEVLLSYTTGLDRYYGLLPLAEKYGVFKKVSTRYELPDGRKVFGKEILRHPEQYYTKEILQQLDEAAAKEFKYGVGEEADVDELAVDPFADSED